MVATMRARLRKLITQVFAGLLTLAAVPVLAEWLIEVARDKGVYDHAGQRWDAIVGVIADFVMSPAVAHPMVGLAGLVAGLWLDNWLRRRDAARMAAPNQDASRRPLAPASRLKTQEDFPLWEAGCLLAGHPVSRDISGEALAWAQRLKTYLVDNPEEDIIEDGLFGPLNLEFRRFSTREKLIENMRDSHRITRETLKRAAAEFGVSISGITEGDGKDGMDGNASAGESTISMDEVVHLLMDQVGYEALTGPAFRAFLQEGRITAFGRPIVGAWDPSTGHSLAAEIKIPADYWETAEPQWTSSSVSAKSRHLDRGLEYGLLRFVRDDVMRCYFSGDNMAESYNRNS
jgi:hypothetical protein